MRFYRIVVFVALLSVSVVAAGDEPVWIEIGGAKQSASIPSDANWGWWDPSKYTAGWTFDDGANLSFTDLRMLVEGGEYTGILAVEFYPTLEAVGSYEISGSETPMVEKLELKGSFYDLGFGQFFGRNPRNGAMPWIGLTYMDLSEKLATTPPPDSGLVAKTDRASAGLWGAVGGVDGSITAWRSVDLTGRLLYRWARGTRKGTIHPQDPSGGEGDVKVSDSIDHSMWGFDIGLRWRGSRLWWVEAAWRVRDRTLDGGPVRYSGPQLKAAFRF